MTFYKDKHEAKIFMNKLMESGTYTREDILFLVEEQCGFSRSMGKRIDELIKRGFFEEVKGKIVKAKVLNDNKEEEDQS